MIYHLYIIVALLSHPDTPTWEAVAQTFTTVEECNTAGALRATHLNQDRNQRAGFVCFAM